ncbi:MAG: OmpA family protein [Alphaproteobacteria bacterium]
MFQSIDRAGGLLAAAALVCTIGGAIGVAIALGHASSAAAQMTEVVGGASSSDKAATATDRPNAVQANAVQANAVREITPKELSTARLPADEGADVGTDAAIGAVIDEGGDAGRSAVERWTPYHEFLFDYDQAQIRPSDVSKVTAIVAHLAKNPSLRLGIDGSSGPNSNGLHDRVLTERRVDAVRDALIKAGVPADRIALGGFAEPQLRRDRQVEVVLGTAN